jgi:hypothetical protein
MFHVEKEEEEIWMKRKKNFLGENRKIDDFMQFGALLTPSTVGDNVKEEEENERR